MSSLRFESFLLLAAAASLVAAGVLAQEREYPIEGTYALRMEPDAAEDRIERAIETATDDMGPLREVIAANRLEDRNPAIDELEIDLRGDAVFVRYGSRSFELPRSQFGSVPVPGGDTARVRARVRDDRLEVDWRMEDGRRHDEFTLHDEYLWLRLRVSSEKLPEAVDYRLPFRRTS